MTITTTTVLLVEDDARIRGALRLALADEGYRVLEAATGEQALAWLTADGVRARRGAARPDAARHGRARGVCPHPGAG